MTYAAKIASWWLKGRSCSDLPSVNSTHYLKEPPSDRPLIPLDNPSVLGEFLGGLDLQRCHPTLSAIAIFPLQARKSKDRASYSIAFPRFPGVTLAHHLCTTPHDSQETAEMIWQLLEWMFLHVLPLLAFHRINHNDLLPANLVCRRPLEDLSTSDPGEGSEWQFAIIDWEFATWHKEGLLQAPRVRGFLTSDCPSRFDPDSDLLFFLLSLSEKLHPSRCPHTHWVLQVVWYTLFAVPLDWFMERRLLYCPWALRPDFGKRTDLFHLFHRIQEPLRGCLLGDIRRYRETAGRGPFSPTTVILNRSPLG